MAQPFLTIDDLTDYLGNLPDWYIQVLEEREKNACDVCPDDTLKIELTDFSGAPISGEPWFVFIEGTNGNAVSALNRDVSPFLNGGGTTTPSPLVLKPGSHVVDVAFGAQTPTTLNLTDAEFGDEYDEQLYIVDTPAQYDGPLKFPSDAKGSVQAAGKAVNGIHAAKKAGVPGDAILDMLGEVDLAMRAALGVYEDLSLTARNDAEARLMLAMQGCPENYHKHPGVHPIYENAESVFSGVAPGTFVGPDGVSYGDPYVARWREGISTQTKDWMSVAKMLELISGWSSYTAPSDADGPGWLERILGGIGDMLVSTAHAQGRGVGGSRGQFARRGGLKTPKRGAGSNPKRKPVGRSGARAHTQAHSRRPVKSNKNVRFKGVKVKIPKRFWEHMDPGHGVKRGQIKGTHTASAFKRLIAEKGGIFKRIGTHPVDARIKNYAYALPNGATGKMRPYSPANVKTTYNMPKSEFQDLVRQAVKNALIRSNGKLPETWAGVTRSGLTIRGFARPTGKGYEINSAWFEW